MSGRAKAPAATPPATATRFLAIWTIELGDRRGELTAIASLVPLLLVAAFWNGFPLIYYDTGAYVFEGLGGHFLVERSPVYSLFLRYAGAGTSLWCIAVIQSVVTAFVITECARAVILRMRLRTFLAIAGILVLATGLPWYVGQIEPDCFTAIVVLAIYLLVFRADAIGRARAAILVAAGLFAAAVHPSHLLLAGSLVLLASAVRAAWWRARSASPRPRLLNAVIVCILGLAFVVAGNFHFKHRIFVSRAGSSFVFARMLQDGLVMRLLDDTCPQSGYRLCAYKDAMPPTANGWLWTSQSPFHRLGGFTGTAAESGRIVRAAVMRYPFLQLRAALGDAATQFIRFRTGDQIEPQEWILAPVLARYLPTQMGAYFAARQQRGEIGFRPIGLLHVAAGWLALVAVVLLLATAIRRGNREPALFLGFILAALIANAVICGVFSGPHDRYQSRVIWLASFAALLAVPLVLRPSGLPPRYTE